MALPSSLANNVRLSEALIVSTPLRPVSPPLNAQKFQRIKSLRLTATGNIFWFALLPLSLVFIFFVVLYARLDGVPRNAGVCRDGRHII